MLFAGNKYLLLKRITVYRPARQHRLAESIPRNRFLGSINVYKYKLRCRKGAGRRSNVSPTPPPPCITADISFEDDGIVILLLDVSLMLNPHSHHLPA
jgi:hypothetical protein